MWRASVGMVNTIDWGQGLGVHTVQPLAFHHLPPQLILFPPSTTNGAPDPFLGQWLSAYF